MTAQAPPAPGSAKHATGAMPLRVFFRTSVSHRTVPGSKLEALVEWLDVCCIKLEGGGWVPA